MAASRFSEVFDENVGCVYGFFAYRLPTRADAEDLTQATFERALAAWSRYDAERAAPRTWLLAIARNQLVDHYRRDRSGSRVTMTVSRTIDDYLPPAPGPDQRMGGVSPELADALAELSDRDREVVALRFGADLTGPEIATELGLSLANVQQILSRSLRGMRERLEAKETVLLGEGAGAHEAGGGGQ